MSTYDVTYRDHYRKKKLESNTNERQSHGLGSEGRQKEMTDKRSIGG